MADQSTHQNSGCKLLLRCLATKLCLVFKTNSSHLQWPSIHARNNGGRGFLKRMSEVFGVVFFSLTSKPAKERFIKHISLSLSTHV